MSTMGSTRPLTGFMVAVMAINGLAALFLPFTFDMSPLRAISDAQLWRFAAPFFLSVLIAMFWVRWMTTGATSRGEVLFARLSSVVAIALTLSIYAQRFAQRDLPASAHDWLSTVLPLVVMVAGVGVAVRVYRTPSLRAAVPVVMLISAFLPNAVLMLAFFWGAWQWGATATAVAAAAGLLSLLMISMERA